VTPAQFAAITIASAAGSAVNAVAGGGTLVTFPTIVWLGVPPLVANATSTVALWPGGVSSMWGYRGELAGARAWAVRFAIPSLAGGAIGAWLLLVTSSRTFDRIVPFLVLGATTLFLLQNALRRRAARRTGGAELQLDTRGPDLQLDTRGADLQLDTRGADLQLDTRGAELQLCSEHTPQRRTEVLPHGGSDTRTSLGLPAAPYLLAQFAVAVYGGYFGAGIGILMLAALGAMGLTNIHQMNGLKNWGGLCINAVAAVMFAASGIVNWPVAAAMAIGGIAGGYAGARLAQRAGQAWVRRAVVAVGFASSAWLLWRAW